MSDYSWPEDYSFPMIPGPFGSGNEVPIRENEYGFGNFVPGGFDQSKHYEVFNVDEFATTSATKGEGVPAAASTSTLERTTATTSATSTSISARFSAIFIIILTATGLLASLLGCVTAARKRKKYRHNWNFLHLILANVCILITLPFVAVTRLNRHWEFRDPCYKILSILFNTGQAACAFQLTYLVFTRCKEVVRRQTSPTIGLNKVICFLLLLGALATAWPTAIYEDVFLDVIKNEDTQRRIGAKSYIQVYFSVSFAAPGIISLACFITAFVEKRKKDGDKKIPPSLIKDAKEVGVLFVLFCICWLPYNAWRILTSQQSGIARYHNPADIVLCVAIAFSTVMPVAHYVFYTPKTQKGSKEFSVDAHEKSLLNVESV